MKKLFALLLALSMLLSCGIACAEDIFEFNAYAEPITITVMGLDEKTSDTVYDSSKTGRASANDNAWIAAYEKYLNIDVERIIAEDATALNANLNTMMASGDLPDVMIVPKEMFYVLAENGVLKDLSETFNSYDGERWMTLRNSYGDEVWNAGMYEGELLGIPKVENFYNSSAVLWVRQDWLDKVGMTIPTTLDELEAVAQAFIDNKLGGDATIGIGLGKTGEWDSDFSSIMAAFGVQLQTWVEKDDKYVYSNTLEENKAGLLRLQEMYKKGLFKADFSVSDLLSEEIANGTCGMYFAPGWHGVTNVKANLLNDETANWVPAYIPTLNGERVKQTTNANVKNFIVVNADCENPDAIFRMKELEIAVYYEAAPGSELFDLYTYTDPDGSTFAMWNLMVFRGLQRGDLDLFKAKLVSEGIDAGAATEDVAVIAQSAYDRCVKGMNGDREQLGLYLTYDIAYALVNELVSADLLVGAYNGPLTENMTLYQQTINDELNAAMVKVIMGEDISVYEAAVASWYKNGGQDITNDVNDYFGK